MHQKPSGGRALPGPGDPLGELKRSPDYLPVLGVGWDPQEGWEREEEKRREGKGGKGREEGEGREGGRERAFPSLPSF